MTIGIWGDSITYGKGDKEGLGWVSRLRNSLELEDDDIEVYNRGVCGHTSADILKRFVVEAESIEPKKIIFAVGANDAKIPQNEASNKVVHEVKTADKAITDQFEVKNMHSGFECSAYAGRGSLSVYNTLFFDLVNPDDATKIEKYLRSNKFTQR